MSIHAFPVSLVFIIFIFYFLSCLGNGRVRCPWHGACFNVGNGDIEDYPGLDNLASYSVRVEGEDVIIKANKQVQDADTKLEIINN